jgi:hypothetical protein
MQRATTSADHLQAEKRALEDRLRQAESEAREWRFRAEGGASELARSTAEKVHIETVHAEQLLRERAQLADRLAEALRTADDEVRRWRTKAEEEADNLIRATSEKARAEAMLAEVEARVAVAEHDGGLSKLDAMTTQAVVDGLRSEKLELEDRLLQTEREMREWVSRTEAGASELGRVQALLAANQALLAANQARIVELELKDRLGQKLAPQLQAAMQEIVELRHRVQGEAADASHVATEKARIENLLSGQFHTEKRQWQIEKRQLEDQVHRVESESLEWRIRAEGAQRERATSVADQLQAEALMRDRHLAEKRILEERLREAEIEISEWRLRAEGRASELSRVEAEQTRAEALLAAKHQTEMQAMMDQLRTEQRRVEAEKRHLEDRLWETGNRASELSREAEQAHANELSRRTLAEVTMSEKHLSEKQELIDRLRHAESEVKHWRGRAEDADIEFGCLASESQARVDLLAAQLSAAQSERQRLDDRVGKAVDDARLWEEKAESEAVALGHQVTETARVEAMMQVQREQLQGALHKAEAGMLDWRTRAEDALYQLDALSQEKESQEAALRDQHRASEQLLANQLRDAEGEIRLLQAKAEETVNQFSRWTAERVRAEAALGVQHCTEIQTYMDDNEQLQRKLVQVESDMQAAVVAHAREISCLTAEKCMQDDILAKAQKRLLSDPDIEMLSNILLEAKVSAIRADQLEFELRHSARHPRLVHKPLGSQPPAIGFADFESCDRALVLQNPHALLQRQQELLSSLEHYLSEPDGDASLHGMPLLQAGKQLGLEMQVAVVHHGFENSVEQLHGHIAELILGLNVKHGIKGLDDLEKHMEALREELAVRRHEHNVSLQAKDLMVRSLSGDVQKLREAFAEQLQLHARQQSQLGEKVEAALVAADRCKIDLRIARETIASSYDSGYPVPV